jgi:hypothetical protein
VKQHVQDLESSKVRVPRVFPVHANRKHRFAEDPKIPGWTGHQNNPRRSANDNNHLGRLQQNTQVSLVEEIAAYNRAYYHR